MNHRDATATRRGTGRRPGGSPALAGVLAAVLLAVAPASAASRCRVASGEAVWVERVVRGDEVVLVDGRRVRLASVEAPRAPLVADAAAVREAAALDAAARAALGDRVEGREISFAEVGVDRHGRRLGHLYDTDAGQWIEAGLVAAGHLRVLPSRAERDCAADLLVEERAAIRARRGLWGSASFAVVAATATDLLARVGRWTVVEGEVRSVGRSGGRTWLNFGEDFRRDFAVVMDDKDLEGLRAAGFDATAARGRTVRVRGVVVQRGGPRIVVEVPEAIERVTR